MSNLIIGDENVPGADIVLEDNSGLNTLGSPTGSSIGVAMLVSGSNITIDGVDVSGLGDGTGILVSGGSDITFQNVLANNRAIGILNRATGTNSITFSTFTNLTDAIEFTGGGTATVSDNNFGCLSGFAIDNNTTASISAENNFWGDASGPANDGGSGESYDGTVDAVPFLTAPSSCAPNGGPYCPALIPLDPAETLNFDGSNDWVQIAPDPSFNPTTYTVEGWVKPESGMNSWARLWGTVCKKKIKKTF